MNRLFVLLLLLISLPVAGSQVAVEAVKVVTDADKTRLILDATAALPHQIFNLDEPDRVVIDIADARLTAKLPEATADDPTLVGLRSGVKNDEDLRIVLDLKRAVRVKSFPTSAEGSDTHRLIIDLIPRSRASVFQVGARRQTKSASAGQRGSRARTAIVAVDAGHGGEDPGATGPRGTREKDVTLAIARKVARLINGEAGMRAVMIRDGDYFVGLRERILKARELKADLFVSIHADADNNQEAFGSSVYTLSEGAASSEAATWLADRENSADLIGGIRLASSDDLLASVLLDMTQSATIEHSSEAAGAVLACLKQVGAVHNGDVQRAGFVVLKAPDIPSMLVETAFISNQGEESRLNSNAHQQRLAQAILAGIRGYFRKYPPQGFVSADADGDEVVDPIPRAVARVERVSRDTPSRGREHVIGQGDTLSGIAKRYRVSLSSLRAENGLSESDPIRVGEVLAIPAGT